MVLFQFRVRVKIELLMGVQTLFSGQIFLIYRYLIFKYMKKNNSLVMALFRHWQNKKGLRMLAYKIECLIHPVIKKGWHNGRLLENIELFKSDSIRHGHTYLKINVVFGVSEKCEIKDNILQCPYLLVFGPVFLRFRQTSLGLFFPWQSGKWDSAICHLNDQGSAQKQEITMEILWTFI